MRAVLISVCLASVGPAMAQDEPPAVTTLVLHPAMAPVPPLKYRILPDRSTLVPGNAAVFYHRAIEMLVQRRAMAEERKAGPDGRTDDEAMREWVDGPLSAIPVDRARAWLDRNRRALVEAEVGARRRDCDWEFESRTEGFDLVIDEIQQMRSLAHLVALQARIAILEHRHDDAVHWLQTGYAMGRHVSDGPILIQAIVAVGCCRGLNKAMEDLIQAPGVPSLYWALVDRPRPFLDLSGALEGERVGLERELPRLRQLDGLPWSVEEGRAFAGELKSNLLPLIESPRPAAVGWGEPETRDWITSMGIAALVAHAYPEAKRSLVAKGRSPASVESMPTIQVVFLDTYESYESYRDGIFKWRSLPFHQAYEGMSRSEGHFAATRGRPLLWMFNSLVGTISSGLMATARVDRQLDALAAAEAVRLFAASHGRLPARLDEIAEAPVPVDPMTGRPFEYRVEGDRAFLSTPIVPAAYRHPRFGLQYELKLAR